MNQDTPQTHSQSSIDFLAENVATLMMLQALKKKLDDAQATELQAVIDRSAKAISCYTEANGISISIAPTTD